MKYYIKNSKGLYYLRFGTGVVGRKEAAYKFTAVELSQSPHVCRLLRERRLKLVGTHG